MLCQGFTFKIVNLKIMKLKSKKILNTKEKVYCLEVPKTHNFCLQNGIVVKNCDLATTGEAAVCAIHKERDENNRTLLVVDFLIKIISPDRISYESVQNFLLDLKRVLNMNIETLSADQYQSTSILQLLEKHKIARTVKRISVDTTLEAYSIFSSIISDKSIRIGAMHDLRNQLNNVYFDYEANTKRGKPRVHLGRKDLSDGLVGACYNAITKVDDIPINTYIEDLDSFFNKVRENTIEHDEDFDIIDEF